MPRLLLLTYFFPPQPNAGAQRPGLIARQLPHEGWQVDVLTRGPVDGVVTNSLSAATGSKPAVKGFNSYVKRIRPPRVLSEVFKSIIFFPDRSIWWLPELLIRAFRAVCTGGYDAVLSTYSPVAVHMAGSVVAAKFGLPWLADYRDPWSDNDYVKSNWTRQRLERALERKLLRNAAAISCVSEGVAKKLRVLHQRTDVDIIPNALDFSDWRGIPEALPPAFTFCYAGLLYGGQRNPSPLFEAVSHLRRGNEPAGQCSHFEFYGPEADVVLASALKYGLEHDVICTGVVPRRAALEAARKAAVNLVLLNMDPSTASEAGSKFLDLVGARRPILAIGPQSSVLRSIITENGLGYYASTVNECADAVRKIYERFSSGQFEPETNPNWKPFTGSDLALRFASVLNRISKC
jgi:glycosyltransferase involved in cell wall biosynthesis